MYDQDEYDEDSMCAIMEGEDSSVAIEMKCPGDTCTAELDICWTEPCPTGETA